MKKFNTFALSIVFLSIFVLAGCKSEKSNDAATSLLLLIDRYTEVGPRSDSYSSATGYQYFIKDPYQEQLNGQNVSFQYTFNTGTSTKDIYFIFTNISPNASSSYPIVSDPDQNISQNIMPETGGKLKSKLVNIDKFGIRGKPEISEFNRNPYAFLDKINPVKILLNNIASPVGPQYDFKDSSTQAFKIDPTTSVAATCRLVRGPIDTAYGPKILNIWVADDCWHDGGTKTHKMTPAMVTALADKFLYTDNHDDDIYDWVTNIFGEEWGDYSSSPLSQEDKDKLITANNEITILLYDINNEDYSHGAILGFFWSKDNFKNTAFPYSNQRIMFYLDAVLLATPINADYNWPAEIVSTLAHEFQHMIHFYQKNVLRHYNDKGTETWIDEMCSMATEDMVSNRIGVNGPRGSQYSKADFTADLTDPYHPNVSFGRLGLYNFYNDISVTAWYSGSISYAINYAFGAYLSRNYGGAKFFHDIVYNSYTDYRAIEDALSKSADGSGETFGSILQKWAIANLLSDTNNTENGYKYNKNDTTWFTSNTNPPTVEYNVGSINLFMSKARLCNADYSVCITQTGPYIYSTMPSGTMPQASNEYYHAATLTGSHTSQTWNIKLKSTVRLTVLAK